MLIILLDVALIRHFWCRFACVYRVWQHSFRTRETLHVRYDAGRADSCSEVQLLRELLLHRDRSAQDRRAYDSCINCGECVDACNRMHQKSGKPGLLTFEFGEPAGEDRSPGRDSATMPPRSLRAANGCWRSGCSAPRLFVWGLRTWEPLHVVVYRAEVQHQPGNRDYRIAISNKLYHDRKVQVRVTGLPAADYTLGAAQIDLPPAGHESVMLSLSDKLSHGIHAFAVEVAAPGWHDRFRGSTSFRMRAPSWTT